MSALQTDTLIVGGGLCGLSLADQLHRDNRQFLLVEARPHLGGRIETQTVAGCGYDLGPTWFWGHQPRIQNLVARFDLPVFEQFYAGDMVFEPKEGAIQRGRGPASMQGSYRIDGGMTRIIDALAQAIPDSVVYTGNAVVQIARTPTGIEAKLADDTVIAAKQIVLALPPRIAGQQIRFDPPLGPACLPAMEAVPTWMAGQAKAVAVFEHAFWRENGLSGDAMSHLGPMVEIHDASPNSAGLPALFGFIGVPVKARTDHARLTDQVQTQLLRLFGDAAAHPKALFIKDWAFDPWTATPMDHAPLFSHPKYGLPNVLADLWGGALVVSGSETAQDHGGYLEGALEAADATYATLTATHNHM